MYAYLSTRLLDTQDVQAFEKEKLKLWNPLIAMIYMMSDRNWNKFDIWGS